MGMDALVWLCGVENMLLAAMDRPEFVRGVAEVIRQWNLPRTEVYLDVGVDLLVRRAWYEGTDFYSPPMYRRFVLPWLTREVEMTHEAGAKFGYIITSAMMPLVPAILAAGVDVIIGVDPVQGKGTDLAALKSATAGRAALWGGVNGFLTVERGTPAEVEQAVREALALLGPGGGFILSPVDNVRDDSPATWRNVHALIEACRSLTA